MRVYFNYCVNCGAKYKYQASGSTWVVDEKYNDHEYCPECKKAILEALDKIPKKSELKWIDTDLVDLDTLLEWEKLENEEILIEYNGKEWAQKFPVMKRVFTTIWDPLSDEHSKTFQVNGREDHKDKLFCASYWPKSKKVISIRTYVRQDMDGNLIKYKTND